MPVSTKARKQPPTDLMAPGSRDIYKHQKSLARLEQRVHQGVGIRPENKQWVEGYLDHLLRVQPPLSVTRIIKLMTWTLKVEGWLGKDLNVATRKDIEDLLMSLERNRIRDERGQPYADWTKSDIKVVIRKFYKWLRNTGEDDPPEVAWIKTRSPNGNRKLPEDLLTEEEVKKMVQAAYNLRDKALIFFLYESGVRVGELLALRIKDVVPENGGAAVTVPKGKTGARRVRVVASSFQLALWLKEHPLRDDREAPLWVTVVKGNGGARREPPPGASTKEARNFHEEMARLHRPVDYPVVRKVLQETAARAGIKKRVNPHNFRHSRATHLARHLTEAQMKTYLGWAQASEMAGIYVHMSGRDVDDAIDRLYEEVPTKKPEESILKPQDCPRCKIKAPAGATFCPECAAPLDIRTMLAMMEEKGEGTQDAKADAEVANVITMMRHPKVLTALKEVQAELQKGKVGSE